MRIQWSILIVMLLLPVIAQGQEERKYIREGYRAYMEENYNEAEVNFRKAEQERSESYIARYNTSTALYQQDKLEESGKRFNNLLQETSDPAEQAKLLHNIGNVMLEGKQYQQAVEAYKQSLKINPGDDDTRYNLAYALEKLREQQQQEQQQQNNSQQNQDQQEQEKQQDQQDQQKNEQQEQENQEQQQQQQQNQQDKEQEEQQPQQQQMSQEEAERLLNAILQKEKDVKEEVDRKKAKAAKIKTDKDW